MRKKTLLTILILLCLVFIWGNSLLPRPVSAALSWTATDALHGEIRGGLPAHFRARLEETLAGDLEDHGDHLLRKAAHMMEFAALSVLFWLRLAGSPRRALGAFSAAALAAAADETIQIFSHRGSQVTDVLIDCAGALLGLALAAGIAAARRDALCRRARKERNR